MTTTTGERWHVRHSRHEGVVVHDENGLIVAYVGSRERHNDARLIAAAPELLDLLREAVRYEREADVDGYSASDPSSLLRRMQDALHEAAGDER